MKSIQIKKRENSPDFILGSFGFKYDEGKEYVNANGYINFDIFKGKDGGNDYIKVNTYHIAQSESEPSPETDEAIPF